MENQRIRLTKRLLKDALVKILQSTTLNKVTISEICAKAGINRTTFYKHYADETALYHDIENDMLKLLQDELGSKENGQKALLNLLYALRENRDTVSVMFNNDMDNGLPDKIFSLPEIVNQIKGMVREPLPNFSELFFFICHGGYEFVRQWINDDCKTPPEEITEVFTYIAQKLLS